MSDDLTENDTSLQRLISSAQNLPFAFNDKAPSCQGKLREQNSDFQVDEVLSFEPCGFGEHLFLKIEKTSSNTEWVIRQLIKKSGLTRKDIGYAGKKDRYSISRQWFSLHLPGKSELIDTNDFINHLNGDGYSIVNHIRHNKKLRVGSIQENQFKIILRELTEIINLSTVDKIISNGFPNYFGYQRFGRGYNNLNLANELLTNGIKINNKNKRSMVISSARSFLFNLQLTKRVKEISWNREIEGDCFMLNNTRSYFFNSTDEQKSKQESIEQRIESGDIHVCGWLPGRQETESSSESKALEINALNKMESWLNGLSKLGLDSSRRAYRALAKNLICHQDGDIATITFSLASGSYATALLRELVDIEDVSLESNL